MVLSPSIVSLPGCADQSVHADTAHIYTHTHLPAHYINMFLFAVDIGLDDALIDFSIGQTAFVVGSHMLHSSSKIMTQEGGTLLISTHTFIDNGEIYNTISLGLEALKMNLIRPHLRTGDLLLFDCRILHFGLANQSNTGRYLAANNAKQLYDNSFRIAKFRMAESEPITTRISNLKLIQSLDHTDHNVSSNEDNIISDELTPVPSRRPVLYVNYHHTWFHDQKNWNENERLFD